MSEAERVGARIFGLTPEDYRTADAPPDTCGLTEVELQVAHRLGMSAREFADQKAAETTAGK